MHIDVALIEWSSDRSVGPRILGRTSDPALVDAVRERLAAQRREELARLEPPVRLVEDTGAAPNEKEDQ